MSKKLIKVLVPVEDGCEEMEAVIIIDILRRAGMEVIVAGRTDFVNCSRGVKLIPDIKFSDFGGELKYDAIILPGGLKGTENLKENHFLKDILIKHSHTGCLIGAICAAPTVLSHFGLLEKGVEITSHPSVSEELQNNNYSEEKVVLSGNIITSRGAGTAFEFSLKIIEFFFGKEKSEKVAESIVFNN